MLHDSCPEKKEERHGLQPCRFFSSFVSAAGSVDLIRKQCDVARSLDRDGQRSLVGSAVSGDAARKDLTSLGDISSQRCDILIIDRLCALCTEHTDFSSSAHAARSSGSLAFGSVTLVKRHGLVPLHSELVERKSFVLDSVRDVHESLGAGALRSGLFTALISCGAVLALAPAAVILASWSSTMTSVV